MFGPRSWNFFIFGQSLGKFGKICIFGHGQRKFEGKSCGIWGQSLRRFGESDIFVQGHGKFGESIFEQGLGKFVNFIPTTAQGGWGCCCCDVVSGAFGVLRCGLILTTHPVFSPVSNEADDSAGGRGLELEHQP